MSIDDSIRDIESLDRAPVLIPPVTNPRQHCTNDACFYTMSHTGRICGREQSRRCECAFCYPTSETRTA